MKKKGFTLVELVIVLVIVAVTSGVFYGLIEEMFESANAIMGRKASYQVAKQALRQMTSEIRWLLWSGPHHNFAIADRVWTSPCPSTFPCAKWEYAPDFPCSDNRFAYLDISPDQGVFAQQLNSNTGPGHPNYVNCGVGKEAQSTNNDRIRFFWGWRTIGTSLRWCLVMNEITASPTSTNSCDGAAGTETILAVVRNNTDGQLLVRYYDQNRNLISIGGSGLTQSQAQEIAWVEFLVTVNLWGNPVTLSETIAVTKRGAYPHDYGAETFI